MQIKAQILSERDDSYVSRRGEKVKLTVLCCRDLDKTHPLINTFDYVFTENDAKQHGTNLVRRTVQLGVTELWPVFGGRVKAKGQIISASAK